MSRDETIGSRLINTLDDLHQRYDNAADGVRAYIPTLVTITELILAVGLFVMLAYWLVLYLG
ncbi:uncharacterized protein Nmag_0820 [Natrialba magadii ATCC 43099]|uniref:Uncharacterized protein n=1 Tax=Natrialba magadii (strain ATCC 43099 / DSM 3394 / CCM 3739 / CIP 104546 / IAM 13178 / JCM 8861 / NBRC 102185 / NCIMB 2190 / MS3) TaxID=547559 RepID=D3T046_NATMM|nr:hypothetical protein [Natrialba magadii]ADD04404.1 uncharacterized protein Nmag_0820 [Natrialba magadii ATCC 43099]ELY25800.1 hypothetical protein C500_16619 [Natrialba magadii ATCC 43099]